MKKLYLILCAVLALVACGKLSSGDGLPEAVDSVQDLVFDFTVNYPGQTKAVKGGWETGDKVFVFFEDVTTGYVTMSYGASGWGTPVFNGTADVSALTEMGKTLTAVFLPFGSSATATFEGEWRFSTTYYSYYMRAERVPYTVNTTDGITTLSADMDMVNPEGYVQFFINESGGMDGEYALGCDAVIPVGVASITADGTVSETSDKTAADDLPSYSYDGGSLFSGKLVEGYNYKHDDDFYYYFALINTADNSRADLFVRREQELASHAAVRLPSPYIGKWVPVGAGITVDLGSGRGTWHTCNFGASAPEELGTMCNWDDAYAAGLPSKSVLDSQSLVMICIAIHGQEGLVIEDSDTNGFIFLPKNKGQEGQYWTSTEEDASFAYIYVFDGDYSLNADNFAHKEDEMLAVRPIQD